MTQSANTDPAIALAVRRAKQLEGLRLKLYDDVMGNPTVGYGHNLVTSLLTPSASEHILLDDIARAVQYLRIGYAGWFNKLTACRKAALIDMMFNIGPGSFGEFRQMIAAFEDNDYKGAAHEMRSSLWHEQLPKRVDLDAAMVECDNCGPVQMDLGLSL